MGGRQREMVTGGKLNLTWSEAVLSVHNTISNLYGSGLSSQHIQHVFCAKMSNNEVFPGCPCRYYNTGASINQSHFLFCTHKLGCIHARVFGKQDSVPDSLAQLPPQLLLPFTASPFKFLFSSFLTLRFISFHFLPLYPVSNMPFNSQPTSS